MKKENHRTLRFYLILSNVSTINCRRVL